jgi:tetratricopeptide (TPR) repeat protein/serine/threonine protein kinase
VEGKVATFEEIFLAAVEKAPADRAAYLDAVCGPDAELRAQVDALLRSHEDAGSLLEQPLFRPGPTIDQSTAERPGTVVGPYKLIEQIGEGGMGTVYMAQQTEPVKRLVALKLINPGMDSKQVLARFEAERQALALMDHPNIAKVFDAGTTETGRPFFVMELVKGVPITKYCDDHRLTPRQRLELFIPVCQAIQHAHQKGIIHRDIKPSNILVAQYDGKPVPKVIDFGVAKAMGQQLTEQTLVTGFGNIIGTLEYMSPEQAELNQLDIDTRSDIYSLGVLLYELLTGSTPLDKKRLKEAAFVELLRVIREEEPQKPSTRLSNSTDSLPSVSAQRQMEPAKLTKLVRGELDWIVMKALEKDRNRRYETANGFAMDVQNYLADEPVQACPPSTGYRLRKFVRRNRRVLTSVGAISVSLMVGLAVTVVLLMTHAIEMHEEQKKTQSALGQAKENLGRADQNLALALESLDDVYMKDVEDRIRRDRRMTEAERASLQKGLQFYERFAQQNGGHADLERATAKAQLRAGFLRVDLKDYAEARANFTQAIAAFEHWADPSHGSVEDQEELARSCYGMTLSIQRMGQRREALPSCQRAIALWRKLSADHPQAPNYRVEVGHCLFELSGVLVSAEPPGQAEEEAIREALGLFEAVSAEHPEERFYRQEVGFSHTGLGDILRQTHRAPQATESYRKAVLAYEGLVSEAADSSFYRQELGFTYFRLSGSLRATGEAQEAKEAMRQALTNCTKAIELDPKNAGAWHWRGWVYEELHEYEKTIADSTRTIELDPKWANGWYDRGRYYLKLHEYEKAIADSNKAVELQPKKAGFHSALGKALQHQRKVDEAVAECRKAVELDPRSVQAHNDLSDALRTKGSLDEAIAECHKAIDLDPKDASAHMHLGNALGDQGKLDEAVVECRKAIELDPQFALAHSNLGVALTEQGKLDEAVAEYRKAIELDPKLPQAWSNRGLAYSKLHEYDKALADCSKAIELAPNFAPAWTNRGMVYSELHEYDKALADFSKAIELAPKEAISWSNRGGIYSELGQYDKALADCSKAIELAPKYASAWSNRGITYGQLHKYDKAIADFSKAIELDPNLAPAWFNRGLAYGELHEYDKALADFSKAIELAPKQAKAWSGRGVTYSNLHQYDKAIADTSRAVELDPRDAVAANQLAWLLATCPEPKYQDPARAVRLAKKATEIAPKAGTLWNTLGVAQYRAGDWKAAIAALDKSMDLLKGGDSFDWFFLAMAHWQLGEKEKARTLFDQAVQWMDKHQPNDEELRRFRTEAEGLLKAKE